MIWIIWFPVFSLSTSFYVSIYYSVIWIVSIYKSETLYASLKSPDNNSWKVPITTHRVLVTYSHVVDGIDLCKSIHLSSTSSFSFFFCFLKFPVHACIARPCLLTIKTVVSRFYMCCSFKSNFKTENLIINLSMLNLQFQWIIVFQDRQIITQYFNRKKL